MKEPSFEDLLTLIRSSYFNKVFDDLDVDEALDDRDRKIFDDQWVKNFKLVENIVLNVDQKKTIDRIREESFKKTFVLTESSELASAVSDDFELMAKYLIANISEKWILEKLIKSYSNGIFPR